jgi:uncharacterized protein (DUF169 family)
MGFKDVAERFIESFGVDSLKPPVVPVGVKFFPKGTPFPEEDPTVADATIPWCGAVKLASEGETVIVTKKNIGCPAAAITLGLVHKDDKNPLEGSRKYTSLMEHPASPADFTDGYVYACKDTGHMEFSLFGKDDCGRYKTLGASLNALSGMVVVEHDMDAIVAFPYHSEQYTPDVVIIGVTPKQALRAIQGYAFELGERIELNTIGIRGVCADVTAYPFLKQKLNGSFFCLGARALSGWEGNRLSFGMPYYLFERMTEGMAESKAGFPYKLYP